MLAFLRNTWRGLVTMRTALMLLFLLAVGAMPGALLPQFPLNPPLAQQYIDDHGWWGRLLNQLQFFNVYGSVWFAAIYVLLFVSLVGCLLPRTVEYFRQSTAKPVITPRNLARMPHHSRSTVAAEPLAVLDVARQQLRGWRVVERAEPDGARSISAERGYLRETGNLIFHFAMLGLIVAFAIGKMYGYSGQSIVLAEGNQQSQWCNSGVLAYDSFSPGLRVDGTDLAPFCIKVNSFSSTFLSNDQADSFNAALSYQDDPQNDPNTWQSYDLKVNAPLNVDGDKVYLAGNGYAPVFTVTYPNGQQRTNVIQWKEDDATTYLSEGATKFDPPGITDPTELHKKQIAVTGLFAPTAAISGGVMTSTFPALNNPGVAAQIYEGNLGSDSAEQSIFDIDQDMVNNGSLKLVDQANLMLGQQVTLPDGTKVKFDAVQRWVSLMITHDPTADYVLVFAVLLLAGLVTSLVIKRRRIWVRVTPAGDGDQSGRTVIDVGGLARTDQAGYGEEFTRLSARILDAATGAHRSTAGKDT
ncbi:MAG TPA: cytochrome c biogenesis protein ResB [Pseudonocardiaceae bacterium]|jgi:cytochrome c biogenesis protein|nr:cytochrome c biogenesis protein ResB [Pseudonocardiaceae bacterium]